MKSENKNLKCVECGAPDETKNIKLYSLQRLVSRKKLEVKGVTLFYASLNLLTNNNGVFPHYMPDIKRYSLERILLSNIFKNINKEVIYKYYPSQNYLYEENPYVSLVKNNKKVKLAQEEDFRYIRTAADIILTSNPSSTLGWCIGLNKPLVYLDSENYNQLEDKEVKKAFNESFFVFSYDNENWVEELIEFLNKPYSEILELWKEKEKYRIKYDEIYFLDNKKNAGQIGAEFIKGLVNE